MKTLLYTIVSGFIDLTPDSVIKFFSTMNENKLLLLLLTPILSIFMSHSTAIYTLSFLILIDLYTGINKDLYHKKIDLRILSPKTWKNWRAVTSSGFRKSWNKVKEYALGILVIHLVEKNILRLDSLVTIEDHSLSITAMFVIVLGGTEVWSIFENLEFISGRNKLKDLLSFLPEKIKEVFKK